MGLRGSEKKKEKCERQNAELQQRVCDQEEELSQLRQLREELVDSDKIKALEEDRCAEGSIAGAARQFNYCDDASSLLTQREHLPSASPSHPAVASFVLQDVHETNVPVSPWPPSRK